MIQKALIGLDGSAEALSAARLGAEISHRANAKLFTLTVHNDSVVLPVGASWGEAGIAANLLLDTLSKEQEETEEAGIVIERKEGAEPVALREIGLPIDRILAVSAREKVDLILLGGHSHKSWERILLGSVSDGVVRHSSCPVLIVRGDGSIPQRILLGIDGSDSGNRAAQAAGELAKLFQIRLDALITLPIQREKRHAKEKRISGETNEEREQTESEVEFTQRVRTQIEKLDIDFSWNVQFGDPVKTILAFSESEHIDLIVVGKRGLGPVESMIFGSVSNEITHKATCSVMITP